MDRLKFISKNLYTKYGLKTKQNYQKYLITNIIKKKNCHIVACIKDSMIYDFVEEFLRRYYKRKELNNNMSKYVNYYKNYLRFFCKPTFRNFSINSVIQNNGEKHAEIYYEYNYGKNKNKKKLKEEKKKMPKELKIIFSDSVKENINDISNRNNNNNSNLSIQLNQSSFRLLSKYNNYNCEDFNDKSITNLLNDLNGTSNTSSSNINNITHNTKNKFNKNNIINKAINKKIKTIFSYNSTKPKIEKFQIDSNKQSPQKNNMNENKTQKIIIENYNKENCKNTINNYYYNNNHNISISQQRNLTKINLTKTKYKLSSKPIHKKNILSTQISTQITLTEQSHNKKKSLYKISIDLTNTNPNYFNKRTTSIAEYNNLEKYNSGKLKIENLKAKNINHLNKQSLNINNKNTISSFNNFDYQQQLLNQNNRQNYKGSFNSTSRNNKNIYSYTQTFSPTPSNRPNLKFNGNNINKKLGNKLYKLSTRISNIA